jgi:cytochrome P450
VFWPGRWLVAEGLESPPNGFVHNTAAFTPFSYGPANCVGKSLAMQEMRMVICLMMQKLDVRKADGYDVETRWENDLQDFFVSKRGCFPVHITRRH